MPRATTISTGMITAYRAAILRLCLIAPARLFTRKARRFTAREGCRAKALTFGMGMAVASANAANSIPNIAAGSIHTVGLSSYGTALAVGWNDYNQCNVGTWYDLVAVASGWGHTVGLRSDGSVEAIGYSYYGECNVAGWSNIIAIAASYGVTVGLKSDGTVIRSCTNSAGGCPVPGWSNVTQIAVGGSSNIVALKADGTALAIGANAYGETQVQGWSNLVQVASGSSHTVGLRADGTVLAVGTNYFGQCNVTNWTNIVSIAAGSSQTLGLKANGTVLIAGNNGGGENQVAGWTNIVALAAGGSHSVGLRADGVVVSSSVTAAVNDYGQAGVGSWYLGPDGVPPVLAQLPARFTAIEHGLVKLKVVAVGPAATSYQWRRNGTNLASAGRISGTTSNTLTISDAQFSDAGNYSVRLANGYGAITSSIVPFQVITPPSRPRPQIAGGGHHSVGLRADGTVFTRGNNDVGQLNLPAGNYASVAAGYRHTLAIRPDGTLAAVGWANNSQCNVAAWQNVVGVEGGDTTSAAVLADGTTLLTSADVNGMPIPGWQGVTSVAVGVSHQVGLQTNSRVVGSGSCWSGTCLVDSWTNVIQVGAGWSHTLGLRNNGTVLVAGTNTYGQCNVTGWSNLIAVAAGTYHSVGLASDGHVLAVGYNLYGQCNVSNWTDIVAISAGEYHTLGLKADGTVVATGDNSYGQLDLYDWYLGTNLVPPIITRQPTNQVAIYGRSTSLRATAAGPGTITYQWRRDGTNLLSDGRIVGVAADSLQITTVQNGDAGSYSVVAANAYGSTTSVLAHLTTDYPPSLSVGPSGSVPFPFDTMPAPVEWATFWLPGGASDIATGASLDARVQTNSAANLTNALISDLGSPPGAMALAKWSSTGQYVQTRPAGVAATLLRASLRNDTGRDLEALVVEYDLTVAFPTTESMGLRSYWSLSGQPNTWQFLNESTNTGHALLTLPLGAWTNHGPLFILWADDNGPGGPDTAYQIDNFSARPADLLSIRRIDPARVQLTWPLSTETFTLYGATDLNAPTWEPIPEIDVPDAIQHRVTISNAPGWRFFRLQKP